VYSGPFTAWNRTTEDPASARRPELNGAARDADPARQVGAATITPDDFDTDFSLPAIKDPGRPHRQKDLARRQDPGAKAGRMAAPLQPSGSATRSRTSTGAAPESHDHRRRPPGLSGRAAAGTARGARQRGRRTARRPGRQPVTLAIVAAVVIVVAGAAILLRSSPGHPSTGHTSGTGTHQRSGHSTSPPPPGVWKYLGQRSTDPVPLTIAELFPRTFISGVTTFRRSVDTKAKSCHGALIGAPLQAAIHKAACTQALRASYWSHGAQLMATIGVFNLKTATGATAAARAAGTSDFVALLPAKTGPTHRLGQGTGIEETVVEGHYLVLVYAEAIKLTAPKTSLQRERLRSFMRQLVIQVTIPLQARKATGQPSAG